ncbi:MAG: 16S rRNA (uracil(1498)-N(3))-methyltransferase [Lentisphaerae bacterium]|jgi:16S rRNA (uracil1498-N3)-methyltransferase|nr:16S rRNA (uracil(1498)-N(3))-methyltransferase [Lentisphaerota bacterium]
MHTAIIDTEKLLGTHPVELTGDDFHHFKTVLHISQGENIRLTDGRGNQRKATVKSVNRNSIICGFCGEVETLPPLQPEVTLFQCIAKSGRMDWLVEKAQEVGVARIVPIVSERTVVRMKAGSEQGRWKRVTRSALRQCGGTWLMDIGTVESWKSALGLMQDFDGPILVGALTEGCVYIGTALQNMREKGYTGKIGVLIGPEGDFTESELREVASLSNSIPVSMGRNVLRVETAVLFAVAGILSFLAEQ